MATIAKQFDRYRKSIKNYRRLIEINYRKLVHARAQK